VHNTRTLQTDHATRTPVTIDRARIYALHNVYALRSLLLVFQK